MIRPLTRNVAGVLAVTCLMTGCASQEMSMEDMAMPQRPAELDQLSAFAGTWVGKTEMTAAGMPEPMTATSTWTSSWTEDKWLLIGNGEMDMGDGHKMVMHEVWTWDAEAKKFRNWWFGSGGHSGEGVSTYDADENCWSNKASGVNLMTGMKTNGTGTMRFTGPNTMEWNWVERDMWGRTIMEMKGGGTRQ